MTVPMESADLLAGFADPVMEAQVVFRAALEATAYPGRVVPMNAVPQAPSPLDRATGALALALLDFETPLWLDASARHGGAAAWLGFHCGTPIVDAPQAAHFALCTAPDAMPHFVEMAQGDAEYPDRSATVILQVPSLENGEKSTWRGPGILGSTAAGIAGLPEWFWTEWDANHELYPAGVDIFFSCGNAIVGLPRTIRVEG